ncbi:MAG: peptidoglycan-binding domain-containing protein [Candidatus Paceibacterota bacterium]|jgi:hypothetical protein
MKNKSFLLLCLLASFSFADIANAATAATLTLSNIGETSSQVTAFGDPNSKVELHYGRYASKVTTLGSTDDSGYLRITLSTSSYDIACDNTAYVFVNGQRSLTIPWAAPNDTACSADTTSGSFSFSEKDIVMTVGQTKTITINGTPSFSIKESPSPIMSATISGSTLTLYARAFGGSTVTVCDSKNKCAALYVVALHSIPTVEKQVLYCPVTPTTSTPSPSGKHFFTLFLTVDSEGKEVTELQKRLTDLGFYTGPITGYFGSQTKAAVLKFQKAKGVDQAGYVGPATRAKLNQ